MTEETQLDDLTETRPESWSKTPSTPQLLRHRRTRQEVNMWVALAAAGIFLLVMFLGNPRSPQGAILLLLLLYPSLLVLVVCLYIIPMLVALDKGHKNFPGVMLVNLFLGWTLVGWIAALIWASHRAAPGGPND